MSDVRTFHTEDKRPGLTINKLTNPSASYDMRLLLKVHKDLSVFISEALTHVQL